jgi:RecB family endonuclease NucS
MGLVSSEGPKLRLTPAGVKLLGKKQVTAPSPAGSLQSRQVRRRTERTSHEYQRKEESPQHKRLMSSLRENPDRLEEGMKFIQEEYLFPTNDSIDLVFRDKRNRYVVVEVEVRVPKGRIAGLLQAIKYKYMLAVSLKLDFRDVRSMLAATEIHPSVVAWCKEYGVETKTISDN